MSDTTFDSGFARGRIRQRLLGTKSSRRSNAFYGYSLSLLALGIGWLLRDRGFINPEQGIGYWLGIVGASMLAVMLLYSVRKRFASSLRVFGPIKYWFRLHMMLGVVGPTLIVLHTNFSLGSTNSRVALFCMVIVALSGLIGRYLYRKIHHGLYGQRASLRGLQTQSLELRGSNVASGAFLTSVVGRLEAYERKLDLPPKGALSLIARPFVAEIGSRLLQRRLLRDIRADLAERARESDTVARERSRLLKTARSYLRQRLNISRKIATFRLYERLFSLWHVLHIPIFILMVMALCVHIYAVHAY